MSKGPSVKRLAVLGRPIGQALSPALHRAAYAALGLPWRYDAVDYGVDELPSFLGSLDDDWAGLSLTMPLKRTAVPLLDEVSDLVVRTGCANTVVVRDGRLIGENTDVHGMVTALREAGVARPASVTVLGAGATACTALAAAHALGCEEVTAFARDPARSGPLMAAARRLGVAAEVRPWTRAHEGLSAALVISAVPPTAADRLAQAWPTPAGALMDVVYRPWPTPLATAATRSGSTVIPGLPMLIHQAARQVVLQTGCPEAPIEAMREAALTAMGSTLRQT
ncbi:shikimate dehydrogenase [Streptantibioticus parmotrematis]|uniref:shikimate dehydrogenase n=1 Tax=Streptantibioticus parmotrematis TaxID=2873249 RepID=UPI0033F8F4DA